MAFNKQNGNLNQRQLLKYKVDSFIVHKTYIIFFKNYIIHTFWSNWSAFPSNQSSPYITEKKEAAKSSNLPTFNSKLT